ncbi:MscL family protein [Candidatus Peregrinibacteria bacterium]|nr:MscL family protein [Candidatus Peregrinibacteria bacterium]
MKNLKKHTEKVKAQAVKAKGVASEFSEFLKEYKIIGIAAGLVIGSAVTTLVQSIVGGLITPALQLLIKADSWKLLVFEYDGVVFQVGAVVSATINFIAIALLFFLFVKIVLKKEKVTQDALK